MMIGKRIGIFLLLIYWTTLLTGQERPSSPDSTTLTPGRVQSIVFADTDSAGMELDIPNVFTPNDDGINDHFEVTTDGVTVYDFRVYTRNGIQIFYSRSPQIQWDGRNSAGLRAPAGVYYYIIEEQGTSDPFKEAGFLHLFR